MSEDLRQHEQESTSHESAEQYLDIKRSAEKKIDKPEKEEVTVEKAEKNIEDQHPKSATELLKQLEVPKTQPKVLPPDNELKRVALNNYLVDIRSHLKGINKTFSKVIHQPFVNSISEASAKTIVRPSAILSGGIFMFVGSSVYLYATYSTNARYNFLVALFLFVGGFIAGLIVELIYNLFFKRSRI